MWGLLNKGWLNFWGRERLIPVIFLPSLKTHNDHALVFTGLFFGFDVLFFFSGGVGNGVVCGVGVGNADWKRGGELCAQKNVEKWHCFVVGGVGKLFVGVFCGEQSMNTSAQERMHDTSEFEQNIVEI